MHRSAPTLVLVAHPGDETLAFSRVCAGADVVSVTDGGWTGSAEGFRCACGRLGGKRALTLCLPSIDSWRLPQEVMIERLKALGAYDRIYTHSPFEPCSHHRDVVLAASRCFVEVWVRSCGGYAAEAHVLSRDAFEQMLELLNQVHARPLAGAQGQQYPCSPDVVGVEGFVPTRFSEVTQALAQTSPGTPWRFRTFGPLRPPLTSKSATPARALCSHASPAKTRSRPSSRSGLARGL
jgi:hypothetical protein